MCTLTNNGITLFVQGLRIEKELGVVDVACYMLPGEHDGPPPEGYVALRPLLVDNDDGTVERRSVITKAEMKGIGSV